MANLNQSEFQRAIQLLADAHGLDRLRDKFFRLRGLVTRRGFKSADNLAQQLYTLSSGLRREVPANLAFQAIWSEYLGSKLGEGAEERFEKLADAVNTCLDPSEQIADGKKGDLEQALGNYEAALAEGIGIEMARLDMIMKAVPAIAEMLRALPPTEPIAAPTSAPASVAASEPTDESTNEA